MEILGVGGGAGGGGGGGILSQLNTDGRTLSPL